MLFDNEDVPFFGSLSIAAPVAFFFIFGFRLLRHLTAYGLHPSLPAITAYDQVTTGLL